MTVFDLQHQLSKHSWLDVTQCVMLGTTGQAPHQDAQVPSSESRENVGPAGSS